MDRTRNGNGGSARPAWGSLNALRIELSVLIVVPLIYFGVMEAARPDWQPSSAHLTLYGMLLTACLAAFGVEYRLARKEQEKRSQDE